MEDTLEFLIDEAIMEVLASSPCPLLMVSRFERVLFPSQGGAYEQLAKISPSLYETQDIGEMIDRLFADAIGSEPSPSLFQVTLSLGGTDCMRIDGEDEEEANTQSDMPQGEDEEDDGWDDYDDRQHTLEETIAFMAPIINGLMKKELPTIRADLVPIEPEERGDRRCKP